ncbi:MAG: flagellar hook-length control protein FliK [Hyphomonadaceae bacterium]
MNFAADIIAAAAPPPRAPGEARVANEDGPSFDDHLAAEERPEPIEAERETAPDPEAPSESEAPDDSAVAPPVSVQSQPEAISPQIVAQMTASAQPAAPAPQASTEETAEAVEATIAKPHAAAKSAAESAGPQAAPPVAAPSSGAPAPAQTEVETPTPMDSKSAADAKLAPVQQVMDSATEAAAPNPAPAAQDGVPPSPVADIMNASLLQASAPPPQQPWRTINLTRSVDATAAPETEPPVVVEGDAKPAPSETPKAAPDAKPAAASASFSALLKPMLQDTPQQSAQPQTQAALPGLGQVDSAGATQHAAADMSAGRAAPHAAVQVAREIIRKFSGESTRFELRLDPPELGRIEVRLDVSRDHRVTAVVAADSPQALSDLARHARELEQALNNAGLELTENGLSFDLTNQRGDGETDADAEGGAGAQSNPSEIEDTARQAARPIGIERWRGARVDLMA